LANGHLILDVSDSMRGGGIFAMASIAFELIDIFCECLTKIGGVTATLRDFSQSRTRSFLGLDLVPENFAGDVLRRAPWNELKSGRAAALLSS